MKLQKMDHDVVADRAHEIAKLISESLVNKVRGLDDSQPHLALQELVATMMAAVDMAVKSYAAAMGVTAVLKGDDVDQDVVAELIEELGNEAAKKVLDVLNPGLDDFMAKYHARMAAGPKKEPADTPFDDAWVKGLKF